MHAYVSHNSRILPLQQASLSPGQAGVFNGWGLFTTMRVYNGIPFAFDRHWKRLSRDAGRIQLPLPPSGEEDTGRQLTRVIEANEVREGCARIYFLYNKIGFWHSNGPFPEVDSLIYTTDLPRRTGPARLGVQEHGRFAAHPLAGTKVTSWLENVWTLEQAAQRGLDEILLLNEDGNVAECTSANVFCVLKGKLATPPLSAGCLAGVTREILLEISRPAGLLIEERNIQLDELHEAEEVFLTSTTREIQAVSEIDGRTVTKAPGPVTLKLTQLLSGYISDYLAKNPSQAEAEKS